MYLLRMSPLSLNKQLREEAGVVYSNLLLHWVQHLGCILAVKYMHASHWQDTSFAPITSGRPDAMQAGKDLRRADTTVSSLASAVSV